MIDLEIKLKNVIVDAEVFEDYQNLVKYLIPKNVLEIKPISEFGWGLVKQTQYKLSRTNFGDAEMIKLFTDFTGLPESKIYELKAIVFFYQIKWIVSELNELLEKEANNLGSEYTAEQLEAGFEDLAKFGYFATKDALANGDVLKYEAIELVPYHVIFTKLLLQKQKAEIDKEYHRIINQKK